MLPFRLRTWLQTVSGQILAAAFATGAWSAAARLGLFGREMVVARLFGTSADLDTWLLAFTIVTFAGVLLGGAFGAAFVPAYVRAMQRDDESADRLLRETGGWGLSRIGVLMLLLALLLPAAPIAFPQVGSQLLVVLAYVMLPVFPLITLRGCLAAVLNARRQFALASGVLVVTPLLTIVILLLQPREWGVYGLAIGTVLGHAAEVAILWLALRRFHPVAWPLRPGTGPDAPVRTVIVQYRHLLIGASLWATAPLVDNAMAVQLGAGSLSTLRFGVNITNAIVAFGASALATAVLPSFSHLAATDRAALRRSLRTWVRIALVTTAPITLILLVV
ncbi:MAG: lipid II flippase MurJ, partial [Planctomycetota bacterium]